MIKNQPCRKAINFDLDTKKLEEQFGKNYHNKYHKLEQDFEKLDFSHRQGSGYVSNKELTEYQAMEKIRKIVKKNPWLSECSKTVDITNVGKQYDIKPLIDKYAKTFSKSQIQKKEPPEHER